MGRRTLFSFVTMASASIPGMRTSFSASFNGCTARPISKALALAWPMSAGSFTAMADAPGPKANWIEALLFTFRCPEGCQRLDDSNHFRTPSERAEKKRVSGGKGRTHSKGFAAEFPRAVIRTRSIFWWFNFVSEERDSHFNVGR